MKRKELKKEIKKFSHKANFYELGLIRKLLNYRERQKKECTNKIPKVICPNCGNSNISLEYGDSEYTNDDKYLYCENCEELFEDKFGFIEATETLKCLCWGYEVEVILNFEEPNINTLEWKNRCRNLILKELNSK